MDGKGILVVPERSLCLIKSGDPTSANIGYPINTHWFNKVNRKMWIYKGTYSGLGDWQELGSGLLSEPYSVSIYISGSPLTLTLSDLNKRIVINSTNSFVVNLPVVNASYIGSFLDFVKMNTGSLRINAAAGSQIADSTVAGYIENTAGVARGDKLSIVLDTATVWGYGAMMGPWSTA